LCLHIEENDSKQSRMSGEELYRELFEIKVQLDVLMELLQKSEEDQMCGWIIWKKVKCHRFQVKLEHRMDAQLNIEELRTKEMNVCICEPEQG
jgi:hypothetical protein